MKTVDFSSNTAGAFSIPLLKLFGAFTLRFSPNTAVTLCFRNLEETFVNMETAFAKPVDEVLSTFGVDPITGLSDEQVAQSRAKHGKNGMRFLYKIPRTQLSCSVNCLC